MSRWSEQFEDNSIHQTIKQLSEWLDVEVKEIDADHEAERRRLKKAVILISEIVSGLDPEIHPEQQLSQLNQHLRQPPMWNNLQTYSTSPTTQPLREANDHLTSVIPNIFQLAALSRQPKAREVIKSVEEAYDAFCSALEKRDSQFKARLDDYVEKLDAMDLQAVTLRDTLATLKQNTETALNNWQSEHTAAQSERAEAFSKVQIERGTKFDEALREWRAISESEIDDISAKHTEKLQIAFGHYKSEAENRISDMKAKHDAIREIHGLVGADGVAGGYQKGASDELKSANFWRWVSMGFLAAAAIWILVKYFMGLDMTPAGEVNWAEVVTAASLTLILLGTAGYAARQSKLHRETEQHMRWFALEVKAIDPFLSSLPVEQQNELKNQLSQKLFGQKSANGR